MIRARDSKAMIAVLGTFAPLKPTDAQKTRYFEIKQLHDMHVASLIAAQAAEDYARISRLSAQKAFAETKVILEILELEMNIKPTSITEHLNLPTREEAEADQGDSMRKAAQEERAS